ncbi:MAG: protoporphyrinogen/coproporphyrinogen oxidase [Gemmatimonadales bacterium]
MSRVVVVGAGIAGLAAAWDLVRAGADVTVLESERRPGGVIVTERRDGFIVEGGPDGFLATEPELPALAAELGIGGSLLSQRARGAAVWTGRALEPLGEGRAAELLAIGTRGADLAAGFRSFARGMAEPVTALAGRLGASLKFAQGVTGLAPARAGWRVALTGGSSHEADGVVLALPAHGAGRLLEAVGVSGARALGEVVYAPSVTVSLAYRAEQTGRPLEGTGFVTSPDARATVRACTYASSKFPGRAPDGHVLLRAFLAPADGDPAMLAHAELAPILGLRGAPLWSRAFYWTRGLPRYPAHHAAHVAAVRERLARLAPLAIAGAGYDGAGVSACVRSGKEAAREMATRLTAQ